MGLCQEARDFRRNQSYYANAESMTAAGVMSSVVFEALDEALLADRAGLWRLLNDEAMFRKRPEAWSASGPAVEFAGFFLARMSSRESPHGFDGAAALGSIGREDPDVIDTLVQELRAGTPRCVDPHSAGYAGPPLAGRLEVALDLLLNATHEPALAFAAIPALASVGRGSLVAMQRVVELAAPQPPRWRAHESYLEYRYDEAMQGRGIAIDALVQFQTFADQVTPTLIEAFDSFEEYDPDQSYHGEHARVCDALAAFGAHAASIVPRLIKFLGDWWERPDSDRTWPDDVFRLLVAIGPAAARALPRWSGSTSSRPPRTRVPWNHSTPSSHSIRQSSLSVANRPDERLRSSGYTNPEDAWSFRHLLAPDWIPEVRFLLRHLRCVSTTPDSISASKSGTGCRRVVGNLRDRFQGRTERSDGDFLSAGKTQHLDFIPNSPPVPG